MKLPLLATLLAYENESVVRHFCFRYPKFSYEEATQLFSDLLAWMWLHRLRQNKDQKTYLFGPLLPLDELWHQFILHTRDYFVFCQQFFGDYFHHDVEPIGFEHEVSVEELENFLADCFQHLGEEWVNRNFTIALRDN